MPELPEVETVRRDLSELVVGRTITFVEVVLNKSVRSELAPGAFGARLAGRSIIGIDRRAKILIIRLDGGSSLLVHLKMSGRLIYIRSAEPAAKHNRVVFKLDNGFDLRFIDMRRFGYVKLVHTADLTGLPELAKLGPEPLGEDFSLEDFRALASAKAKSVRPIKGLLIDQSFIGGIGNLYADEILHVAAVNPRRPIGSLGPQELKRVYTAIRTVLEAGIKHRGTTFDLYVDARGDRGRYVDHLKVYGRRGEPCSRCGAPIEKIRLAGRGTHFCSLCQK